MKILIAEDDVTTRRLLEALISGWGYEVVSTKDGGEAWEVLQSAERPKLAIVDWVMPVFDGMQLCEKLRNLEKNQDDYTYLIFLTQKDSQKDIIAGMAGGADDYVTKPFHEQELKVRLRAGARIAKLQADLVKTKKELLIQSRTDPLTGCLNRRALYPQLESEISRGTREKSSVAISLLDIDHFKLVNDAHGHDAGDEVLRECVKCMEAQIRPYDFVGRFGGEEFLIVAPGATIEGARALFERIRVALAELSFSAKDDVFHITASQGITSTLVTISADDLVKVADRALYEAKKTGRNCIVAISGD